MSATCKVCAGNLQCRRAVPRSIRNAGKYKRRASDVDSCLTCQNDLKPTTATVGGRYFATLKHKRLEAQMCLSPRVPDPF